MNTLFSFFQGGGEMGLQFCSHDWHGTALGPPEEWPQSLRTVVRLALNARRPAFIFWGPESFCLYNEAYRAAVAEGKHSNILGQPASQVLGELWAVLGPRIEQVMRSGEASYFYNQLLPLPKGSSLDEVYWTYSFTPIDDDQTSNKVGGVLVTTSDTTALVLNQQQSVLEAKRQRSLLQRMPGFAAVLAEPDHRFEYVNDAYMAIAGQRNFLGRTVRDVFPELEGQGYIELLDRVYTTGEPFSARAQPIRLGGENDDRFIDFLYTPTRDDELRINGIFVAGYDVTEQVRAKQNLERAVADLEEVNATLEDRVAAAVREHAELQDALRQSQKMEAVGQLTGGLAHDFNNLLAGMSGSLQLARKRLDEGRAAEIGRYVDTAQGAVNRAASLTHRLLAFSRRQSLSPEPLNLNRLAAGMEELVRRTIGPQVALELVSSVGLWGVWADRGQLENALLNLCLNARDAMPHGGRITIETGNRWIDDRTALHRELAPGQYVSLCVSDTGCGMSPEVVERAFEPFYTTKPIGVGTGLGLSMVYGFAKQSGGQVRIYSEVNKGTMVCIYLPRRDATEAEQQAEASLPPAPVAERGETVLVVDDEPTIRMFIVEVMEELGYATLEAGNGADALKILGSGARVDLLISDVGLPGGMNGRQVADAARVARPKLKVLFVTGYAENAVLSHGHLDPGMHVMTKPFDIEVLARRVKELINDIQAPD